MNTFLCEINKGKIKRLDSIFQIIYLFICFETGSHYTDQTGLKIIILLPQPPSAGIADMYNHNQLQTQIFCCTLFYKTSLMSDPLPPKKPHLIIQKLNGSVSEFLEKSSEKLA
jgi:hypothetical protein